MEWHDPDDQTPWTGIGHEDFGDVWGVLWHHMGVNGQGPDVIRYGVPGLKGPIANIHIALDGTVTLVAAGVAWHAGYGSYPGLPKDDANDRLIGVEMAGNGTDPWPRAVWDAAVKVGAAISRFLGYDAGRNIAHKEWAGKAQGKWDPGNWDMNQFRREIQSRIDNGPAKGGDMNVWDTLIPTQYNSKGQLAKGDNVSLPAWEILSWIDGRVARAEGALNALTAAAEKQNTLLEVLVDQVCGAGSARALTDKRADLAFKGWEQSGGRTLMDLTSAVAERVLVEGTFDKKKRQ
ncbi:peptidoglycan recognition protein family protein [Prescottella equi]